MQNKGKKSGFLIRLGQLALTAIFLSSCKIVLSPEKQLEHLRPLPSMAVTENELIKNKALFQRGDWPIKEWWRVYQSPELDALMCTALQNNPSIREVHRRVAVARQETRVVRSALFPLVYFKPYYRNFVNSSKGLFRAFNPSFPISSFLMDIQLTFNYEFDFWWKYHNLFYESIGRAKAEAAEAAEVELITTTALAQAFFAYQTNLLRKQLFRRLLFVRTQLFKLNNMLQQKGLDSAFTPYGSIESVNQAKKFVAGIEEELAIDQHLINILAGCGPETPLKGMKTLAKLPKKLLMPQTLSLDLIARRPDLMAQIWRAKSLAYKTGAAKADFYPNVNLVALAGFQSVHWSKLLRISSGETELNPALSLPIFTAGAIKANINAQKAKFDAAIEAYNQLLLNSTKEVLDVLASAKAAYQQKHDQDEVVIYARKTYRLTRLLELKGLRSAVDRYTAESELIQKQLDDVLLLYQQYMVTVKLTKALGGGYCQNHIPLVNRVMSKNE